ncbi:probable cytochrome P450 6a14 [Culex pipiens pallens]|uniref:probable cytochrome P450 6a14 n=1 Tax=Culex pipiens pallens TaxID=42434 RepID=UPI00195381E2|nr:probable cytochrome P450 6a14 [Culex pipiens pallens]
MAALVVALLVTVLTLAIWFVKRKYSYWSRQNVPHVEPSIPYGNFKELGQVSIFELSSRFYNQMKTSGRYFGLYFFLEPILVVTDLDLIKTIMIKDFAHFPDRGQYYNARDDPLSAHLFNIEGNGWRSLRARLTPTFTSGKMKMMFPTLKVVADRFAEYLTRSVDSGDADMEVKDCFQRFTIDVIGSCAFGIECNSFTDPDSRFRKVGNQIFSNPRNSTAVRLFLKTFPDLGRMLRIKSLNSEATEFFYKTVQDTVGYRKANGVERNDFLNLLLELEKKGVDLSMDEIAAQAFLFFIGGFETSSSTQTFCMYELSLHPDIQDKARQCVLGGIKKHGGLTYEAVSDMPYLDQCINETLRKYPTLPILERKTFKDYQIPDSNVVIQKGTRIQIPVYALQRDERYYPEPDRFDPDRFTADEMANRHVSTFLPFGEGPRVCIGQRLGMMQSRVGLATVLSNFKASTCAKSQVPLQISSKSAVLQPQQGVWVRVEPLK